MEQNKEVSAPEGKSPEVRLGDFDPRIVHQRNPKTGVIEHTNPYKLHVVKGERFYEWPKGSGNLYFENRVPAGRMENGKIVKGAAHVEYHPPETTDDVLARKLVASEQERKKLLAELKEARQELESSPKKAASKSTASKS